MDVASPIDSVVPSLDGPVLGALAGTTAPLTLTDVRRLAGRGSLAGVRRVLRRLVGTGLVLDVPGGYQLNRDHLAAPAVDLLANLHGELHDRIRRAVDAWGGDHRLVAMFGSAARRDGDEASDIDVLLVSDDNAADEFAPELAGRVERWTGNPARVFVVTTSRLRRMVQRREPIVASWQRDLAVITGDRRVVQKAG